jgi:hypothetical protein
MSDDERTELKLITWRSFGVILMSTMVLAVLPVPPSDTFSPQQMQRIFNTVILCGEFLSAVLLIMGIFMYIEDRSHSV